MGQVVWYSHLFKNFPEFAVIHTIKGFDIVNKAEVNIFLELSCFFDDPWMLAIWSLVPLPFLNPAWTSGRCSASPFIREIQSRPQWDITSHPSEWLLLKCQELTNIDENMNKRETLCILLGMSIGAAAIQNNMEIPQKIKDRIQFDPVLPFLIIYVKNMKTLIWKRFMSLLCSL